MKDRSGEEVRRYFGKALKICLHHEWTSFVMEMVSCVNNCPRLSLVNLITCLCWVTDQIIKKLGVSQSEIIFLNTRLPSCQENFFADVYALGTTFMLRYLRDRGWDLKFNMCIESLTLLQILCKPAAVSEEPSENTPEEMKAAVNLCQQCQRWENGSLQSREKHVFIIICHPSA